MCTKINPPVMYQFIKTHDINKKSRCNLFSEKYNDYDFRIQKFYKKLILLK